MGKPQQYNIDIAILTAIPIEILAALRIFSDDKYESQEGFKSFVDSRRLAYDIENNREFIPYHFGYIHSHDKLKKYSVLIAKPTGYGDKIMSSFVTSIDKDWNPHYYFLIGIAMSFSTKDCSLGDLVLANRVICQSFKKIEKDEVNPKVDLFTLTSEFQRIAFQRVGERDFSELDPDLSKKGKSISGTFFSSNELFASTSYRKQIKKKYRKQKLVAGEMECLGILTGASNNTDNSDNIKDRLIMAKGISDYGNDVKKDTKWRYIAALHSAKFVKEFILSGEIENSGKRAHVDEDKFSKLSKFQFRNWLGEMQISQGLLDKAEVNFNLAWKGIINTANDIPYKEAWIARIASNISKIDLDKGRIENALTKSIISLVLSKTINEKLFADALFNTGRVIRESELMKTCDSYFSKAKDLYQEQNNQIGLINTFRWLGYTRYKYGDYLAAYKDIFDSYSLYLEYKETGGSDRIVISEIYDMLGRCLREIANKYDDSQYKEQKFKRKPESRTLCVLKALNYFSLGNLHAEREGNYYRLAESYLSYVILFSQKNISPIVKDIVANQEKYKNEYLAMLEQSHEKNKDLNTLFFSYLSPSMTSNIEKNYSLGVELTKKWNYSLLACLFYKHKGEYYFNNGDYGKAFTEYAKWINISQKNIRPQERYRSFAEINEKLIELDEKKMQKYFQILEDKCEEKVELFSDEFYRSVKK